MTAIDFEGFPDPKGSFFKALAKNQDRDWFQEHKERYERQWAAPMLACLERVRSAIDATYSYCDLDEPKVFRIFRDVRFGKDKTPFKTHVGGTISITGGGGVMDKPVAVYLQLGTPAESFAAAGHYRMPPDRLRKFREAVVDPKQGAELTKIVKTIETRGFRIDSIESLSRVPKGFDPEHPLAHVLKMKGLIAHFPALPDISEAAFATWLARECKAVADLVTWTTYATAV